MLKILLNSIFPSKCIFCNCLLDFHVEIEICNNCYKDINFVESSSEGPIRNLDFIDYCDGLICLCEYSGIIKDAIKKFKFSNKPHFYRTFSMLFIKNLININKSINIDTVVSVPLHKKRELERGYNQSYLISKKISKHLKIEDASNSFIRVKNTKIQSLLSKEERMSNLEQAFIVTKKN